MALLWWLPSFVLREMWMSIDPRPLFAVSHFKRNRPVKCQPMEDTLLSLIYAQFNGRRLINEAMIQAKGRRLFDEINQHLPQDEQIPLQFSNGWIQSFQKRCNLRSIKCHGESGDCSIVICAEALDKLRQEIKIFPPQNVFNCDEFGHFYQHAPDRTIAHERMEGRKQPKKRLPWDLELILLKPIT